MFENNYLGPAVMLGIKYQGSDVTCISN